MTGDADYLLRVVVPDVQALERFIVDFLTRVPGVGQHPVELRTEAGEVPDRAAAAAAGAARAARAADRRVAHDASLLASNARPMAMARQIMLCRRRIVWHIDTICRSASAMIEALTVQSAAAGAIPPAARARRREAAP